MVRMQDFQIGGGLLGAAAPVVTNNSVKASAHSRSYIHPNNRLHNAQYITIQHTQCMHTQTAATKQHMISVTRIGLSTQIDQHPHS